MGNVKIKVNGEETEIKENSSIQDLLDARNSKVKLFVVEKNLKIVPKDKYDEIIQENDVFEIATFCCGG